MMMLVASAVTNFMFAASLLAALYDNNDGDDQIAPLEKSISDKYEAKSIELYNALGKAGKAHATRHGIKVKDVNPSPQ